MEDVVNQIRPISQEKAIKDWKKLCELDVSGVKLSGRVGNQVMDYLFFAHRLQCRTKEGLSFLQWIDANKTKPYVIKMMRHHVENGRTELRGYYSAFQLYSHSGTIGAFKPLVAKAIVKRYNAKRVLDICSGWGGRALGALAAGASYMGYDTNHELEEAYERIKTLLVPSAPLVMNFQDSSQADFTGIDYDMVLTSPPYFLSGEYSQERYLHMPTYESRHDFNTRFFFPVIKKVWESLQPNGVMCLNLPVQMYNDLAAEFTACHETMDIGFGSRFKQGIKQYTELLYVWKKSAQNTSED